MKNTHKLDIFKVIENVQLKNYAYYDSLTDVEKKEINFYALYMWLNNTTELDTILLNEYFNKYMYSSALPREFLWKLLCSASSGTKKRVKWDKKNTERAALTKDLAMEHDMSIAEASKCIWYYDK